MRTLRVSLAGPLCLVVAAILPATVVAQGGDPADATSNLPGDVTTVRNLVYAAATSPDEATELTLTVFHPAAGGEDAPMVVDVGGWAVDPQALAERGVRVFSMSYPDRWPTVQRTADPTAMREMADALACAIRFARGSEYGSETAPLVLAGFSRQGGLAAHVALAGEDFDRVWADYEATAGGPPANYDCTFEEASTRVDGLVGVAGTYDTYVGYDGLYGREFLLAHEPELWEMLWGTVGLHPELRVRLLHGKSDSTIPLMVSAGFEYVLAEAGYDVELVEFDGGHSAPLNLVAETLVELFS